MHQQLNTPRDSGFTIVELLVALVLSSILSLLIFTLFTSNAKSVQFTNAYSEVHKNVRMANLLLTREFQSANNWGCMTGTEKAINNISPASAGYDATLHKMQKTFIATEGDSLAYQMPDTDSIGPGACVSG